MLPKKPYESSLLYGLHDPGGEHIMLEMGAPGWVEVTEAIGFDPKNKKGKDYTYLSDKGLSVMVRLNAGYAGVGTLPFEKYYESFAQRCANFVRASAGAHIWIIGNEPNHPIEWPGAEWDWNISQPISGDKVGEKITPDRYARAYRLVREAIHNVPGHEDDLVLPAAVAPWNALCTYPRNPRGDWLIYFRHMLTYIGADNLDGITIHAYTHGSDPNLIDAETRMNPPFQWRRYEFRVYRDFMAMIPWNMQHLPVYVTETDQNEPWANENRGWVKRAYGEIDYWNKTHPFRPIRALVLYRWSKSDQWYIEGKQGVIQDFREAMTPRYRWDAYVDKAPPYRAQFQVLRAPRSGDIGDTLIFSVAIRNIGRKTWISKGKNNFRVGYHWKDAKGNVVHAPDFRTSLPHDVNPGEWVQVKMKIGLPSILGTFHVHLDMVHEGVTWFADQGSRPARVPVRVTYCEDGYIPTVAQAPMDPLQASYLDLALPETEDAPAAALDLPAPVRRENATAVLEPVVDVPRPPMLDIIDELPRREDDSYAVRLLEDITHIAVHHSAVPANVSPDRIAAFHVYNPTHQWPGIGYHFYIWPRGEIFQTQPLDRISWHVYKNNSYTVGVCLAGNFNATAPPELQLNAAAWLIAWLMQRLDIPLEGVLGHKEFPLNATACPGHQWDDGLRWRDRLFEAIQAVRTGRRKVTPRTIRHYVLFWKHDPLWAVEDWAGAGGFVSRFDAAAGFSEAMAMQSELVTIVGGPAGVSPAVEARLRAAGCIVQRVAGANPAETVAMLQGMAAAGVEFPREKEKDTV